MSDLELPSYAVNVSRLPKLGATIKLSLDDKNIGDKAKKALVEHLGIQRLDEMSAQMVFSPWKKDSVQVEGEVTASLYTQCSATLEDVFQSIEAPFKARFVSPTSKLAKPPLNEDGEMVLDFDGEDLPDTYEGDTLDAWVIALEYLLLEIDFFARAEGAVFRHDPPPDLSEEEKASPFAILQSLKK